MFERVPASESKRLQGVVGVLRRGKLPCTLYFRYFGGLKCLLLMCFCGMLTLSVLTLNDTSLGVDPGVNRDHR